MPAGQRPSLRDLERLCSGLAAQDLPGNDVDDSGDIEADRILMETVGRRLRDMEQMPGVSSVFQSIWERTYLSMTDEFIDDANNGKLDDAIEGMDFVAEQTELDLSPQHDICIRAYLHSGVLKGIAGSMEASLLTLSHGLRLAIDAKGRNSEAAATFFHEMGSTLNHAGKTRDSITLYDEATRTFAAAELPTQAIRSAINSARAAFAIDDFRSVLRTLEVWQAAVSSDADASERMIGDFYNELGKAYVRSGEPQKGLASLLLAFSARSTEIAENQVAFVNTVANLARACEILGEYEGASRYRAVLREFLKVDHPQFFAIRVEEIAGLLDREDAAGARNEILRLFRECSTLERRPPGMVVLVSRAISKVRILEGNWRKALGSISRVLARVSRDAKVEFGECELIRATILVHLGKLNEASESAIAALTALSEHFGTQHYGMASAYSVLGSIQMTLGDYEGAAESYARAFIIRRDTLGLSHPLTLVSQLNAAANSFCEGKVPEASAILELAESGLNQLIESHPWRVAAANLRAMLFLRANQVDSAEAILVRLDEVLSAAESKDTDTHLRILGNIVCSQLMRTANNSALETSRRALTLLRMTSSPDPLLEISVLNNSGVVQLCLGQPAEAMILFRRALRVLDTLDFDLSDWKTTVSENLREAEQSRDGSVVPFAMSRLIIGSANVISVANVAVVA